MEKDESGIVSYYFEPSGTVGNVLKCLKTSKRLILGGDTLDEIYDNYMREFGVKPDDSRKTKIGA